jgi:winged helix-turn-helix DNA-binding protein
MLTLSLVKKIERLLQDGKLSQRKIAERVGVSRGTVAAVASGRPGIHGREPSIDDHDPWVHLTPPERCPLCGFLVYMPCLVCRTREHRQWQRIRQEFGAIAPAAAREPRRRTQKASRRPLRNRSISRSRVA